eukprot:5787984-Pleurochrysis_carterae.AAC.2
MDVNSIGKQQTIVAHANSSLMLIDPYGLGRYYRETRLCMGAVEACEEIEARSHEGPIVDGQSARQFARQNGGDVTLWVSQLSLACYACLPPTYAWAHGPCAHARQSHRERAREY